MRHLDISLLRMYSHVQSWVGDVANVYNPSALEIRRIMDVTLPAFLFLLSTRQLVIHFPPQAVASI